jgi:7-cyano-7-deazaguanine synthase
MPRAVVLLSGGLDSATVLAFAKKEGFDCYAISFDYGQRHRAELAASAKVVASIGAARHLTLPLNLRPFGGSALTSDTPVPKDALTPDTIPVTYVPARNTVFLSLALGWAETLGAHDIFIGVNALDYSGYPDCRPAFLDAFEKLANVATKDGVEGKPFRLHAPLLNLTKKEIISLGLSLGVDYSLTRSCYDPIADVACGHCDSCLLRLRAFAELGSKDPIQYAEGA